MDEQKYRELLQRIQHGCFNYKLHEIKEMVDEVLTPGYRMETVKVTRWECLTCGFIEMEADGNSPNACCRNDARMKLTGEYQVSVPRKFHRVQMEVARQLVKGINDEYIPISAKLYAEWIE